jgi:glycosyltransferase involved in cell wall biosynthesis
VPIAATRRVLFVLPSFEIGGAQRVCLTLLANIDQTRFAPELVVFDACGGLDGLVPAHVPVHNLKRPRLRQALPALLAAFRRTRPDVVFSTLGYVNLAVLAMRPLMGGRTRVVVRESNLPSIALPSLRHAAAIRFGYRLLYPHADRVITQSRRIGDELVADFGVSRQALFPLRNPVDVNRIRAAAHPILREPGPGLRLVAVGHLIHQKGYDRLLSMFAALPPDAYLTFLGDGAERPRLAQQATALGVVDRVRFAGFVPRPWRYVAGADAFVMPSRWEGMPNAALEALACGVPVLATPESGGLIEVAEEVRPEALRLVSCGDAFVAAMRELQPRSDFALRASTLPPSFALDQVVTRFEELLA